MPPKVKNLPVRDVDNRLKDVPWVEVGPRGLSLTAGPARFLHTIMPADLLKVDRQRLESLLNGGKENLTVTPGTGRFGKRTSDETGAVASGELLEKAVGRNPWGRIIPSVAMVIETGAQILFGGAAEKTSRMVTAGGFLDKVLETFQSQEYLQDAALAVGTFLALVGISALRQRFFPKRERTPSREELIARGNKLLKQARQAYGIKLEYGYFNMALEVFVKVEGADKTVGDIYMEMGSLRSMAGMPEYAAREFKNAREAYLKAGNEGKAAEADGRMREALLEELKKTADDGYAARLHDEWRSTRGMLEGVGWAADGQSLREPRWKAVGAEDPAFAGAPEEFRRVRSEEGRDVYEVDIANLPFHKLPAKFRFENAEASKGVMQIIRGEIAKQKGRQEVAIELESASALVHRQWLERNHSWAPPEQNRPYSELAEVEKEKDRAIVRGAVDYMNGRFEAVGLPTRIVLQ